MRGRGWTTLAGLSVDGVSRWLRRLAPPVVLAVAVSLLASTPLPAAAADPVIPPGATRTPPQQQMGSGHSDPSVPTEVTQGVRGGGVAAPPVVPSEAVAPPVLARAEPVVEAPTA